VPHVAVFLERDAATLPALNLGEQNMMYKKKPNSKHNPKCWIIVGHKVSRNKQPYKHNSFPEAITEAKRLAELHPKTIFRIFELRMSFQYMPDVEQPEIGSDVPERIWQEFGL
jgi:hypothetical protein